jgi:hypothetical protein
MKKKPCPFKVGDYVRFTPSKRTLGLYQNIEGFGVSLSDVRQIQAIKNGLYLYFGPEQGGWPWNEFTLVKAHQPESQASPDGVHPSHRTKLARKTKKLSEPRS